VISAAFSYTVHDATAGSNVASATITVNSSGPRLVYSFPLDSNPGWTTQGAWAFGQPTGGGSHDRDPSAGFTGNTVYGYNLAGDYANNLAPKYLTTTSINCASVTDAQLRFRRWLGVEDARFDHATLEASANGVNWTMVWQNPAGLGAAISESAWSLQTYDVSAVADGQATLYLRWGMGSTDTSGSYPGWNIDDVEIWGIVPMLPADFNGDGLINLTDLAALANCLTGPGGGIDPGCRCKDMDDDGDVDLEDFAGFQGAFDSF
jgi:hypothetical protein